MEGLFSVLRLASEALVTWHKPVNTSGTLVVCSRGEKRFALHSAGIRARIERRPKCSTRRSTSTFPCGMPLGTLLKRRRQDKLSNVPLKQRNSVCEQATEVEQHDKQLSPGTHSATYSEMKTSMVGTLITDRLEVQMFTKSANATLQMISARSYSPVRQMVSLARMAQSAELLSHDDSSRTSWRIERRI